MNQKHFYIILILSSFNCCSLFSQFDIKLDPAAAIIAKNIKGGIEVGITQHFSIDVDATYSNSVSLPFKNINFNQAKSGGFRVMGKVYPKTKYGSDGFYFAPYLKYRNSKSPLYKHNRFAMGLMTGFKIMLPRKFYFDIGSGFGFRIHSSIRDSTGDYLDGLTGTNFFGSIYDFFSDSIGKYDFTTRIVIGYRLSGNTRPRKNKEIPIALL